MSATDLECKNANFRIALNQTLNGLSIWLYIVLKNPFDLSRISKHASERIDGLDPFSVRIRDLAQANDSVSFPAFPHPTAVLADLPNDPCPDLHPKQGQLCRFEWAL